MPTTESPKITIVLDEYGNTLMAFDVQQDLDVPFFVISTRGPIGYHAVCQGVLCATKLNDRWMSIACNSAACGFHMYIEARYDTITKLRNYTPPPLL